MGEFFGSPSNPRALGGKGFFSPSPAKAGAPVVHSLVFTAGNSGGGLPEWAASGAVGTTISGSFFGSPPAFGEIVDGEVDSGTWFSIYLPCTTPAGAFTKLVFSGGFSVTLLESAALFHMDCGFNRWRWPGPLGMPIGPVINLDIT